jgi:imidazolonepropionase-like amidohydrolase
MAHAYTDEAVRRCLQSGIRSIEHGNYVNEETVAIMAERGAFIDPTFISLAQRIESASATGLSPMIVDNLKRTLDRGRQVYTWARSQGVPIGFGIDLWGADARRSQLREFEMRMEIDDSVHIIHSATTINAELLMQKGTLGTIAPGACADLLVIDGDPLSDLKVMTDPRKRLKLIMKDGHIVKNEL